MSDQGPINNTKIVQDTTLSELMGNTVLSTALYVFMEGQFSQENFLFIRDLDMLPKEVRSPTMNTDDSQITLNKKKEEFVNKYKTLYSKYIAENSPSQVNISDEARTRIKNALDKTDDLDIVPAFEEARKQIANLIMTDIYPRFRATEAYSAALEKSRPAPQPNKGLWSRFKNSLGWTDKTKQASDKVTQEPDSQVQQAALKTVEKKLELEKQSNASGSGSFKFFGLKKVKTAYSMQPRDDKDPKSQDRPVKTRRRH